ncbi:hypothetical protein L7F22_039498 [Adiantum nelumboides]|nr:hypothetical protein [Adiantum nelumboides]
MQIVSEKLTEDNFHAWKFRITNYLKGKGHWDYVKGANEAPLVIPDTRASAEQVKSLKDWHQGSAKVLYWLYVSVLDSIVSHIQDADSPKDTWDNLIAFNATTKRARKMQLKNELNTIKKGDLSVNDYTLKIKALSLEDVSEEDETEVTSEDISKDSESNTTSSSSDEGDVAYLSKDEFSLVEVEGLCAVEKEENIIGPKRMLKSLCNPILEIKQEECIGEINDDEFEELMLLEARFSMEPTIISLDNVSEKDTTQGMLNIRSEEEHVYETMHEIPLLDDGEEENLQNDALESEVDDCMHNNNVNAKKSINAIIQNHVQELDVLNNIERDEIAIIDDFLVYLDKEESEDTDDDIMATLPYEKIQEMPPIEEYYNILFVPSQECFIGKEVMQSYFLANDAKKSFIDEDVH